MENQPTADHANEGEQTTSQPHADTSVSTVGLSRRRWVNCGDCRGDQFQTLRAGTQPRQGLFDRALGWVTRSTARAHPSVPR